MGLQFIYYGIVDMTVRRTVVPDLLDATQYATKTQRDERCIVLSSNLSRAELDYILLSQGIIPT